MKRSFNIGTKTMRVQKETYEKIEKLKELYASKVGKNASYSDFLEECCYLGERMLNGNAFYYASGSLYPKIEDARGASIQESVRLKQPAQPPVLMLKLDADRELPWHHVVVA